MILQVYILISKYSRYIADYFFNEPIPNSLSAKNISRVFFLSSFNEEEMAKLVFFSEPGKLKKICRPTNFRYKKKISSIKI